MTDISFMALVDGKTVELGSAGRLPTVEEIGQSVLYLHKRHGEAAVVVICFGEEARRRRVRS